MEYFIMKKIIEFIKLNKMIQVGDTIIVGLSGGADSVCMLLALKELQKELDFGIRAVHINHCIRGIEADKDADFAKKLCTSLCVPFNQYDIQVKKLAEEEKLSIEEAGRQARYNVFNKLANEAPNGKIAVAHHMDDQAETVIMNILRGSALKGVCGMQPVRDNIIRPLLCVKRVEIEEILRQNNQAYCIDSTNKDNEYTRNKLRNVLIPYIKDNININSVENICSMAATVSEAQAYIKKQEQIAFQDCVSIEHNINNKNIDKYSNLNSYVIDVYKFKKCDSIIQKYIVHDILGQLAGKLKDIYRSHVERIVELKDKEVGASVDVAYAITAKRSYKSITIEKSNYNKTDNKLKQNGYIEVKTSADNPIIISSKDIYDYINSNINIFNCSNDVKVINDSDSFRGVEFSYCEDIAKLRQMDASVINDKKILENSYTKVFDYDKINFTLQLRTRRAGDIIQINKNGGTKKLKDYFIDQKIDKAQRDNILLLADGSHIVWIIGYRISEEYKVTDDTKRILYSTVKFER